MDDKMKEMIKQFALNIQSGKAQEAKKKLAEIVGVKRDAYLNACTVEKKTASETSAS